MTIRWRLAGEWFRLAREAGDQVGAGFDGDRGAGEILGAVEGLGCAAEVLGEEHFGDGAEGDLVLGLREAVALVGEDDVVRGTLRCLSAATICSDSARVTRTSSRPCAIRIGRKARSMWVRGERSRRNARPSSVSGSPMRFFHTLKVGAQ